MPYVIRPPKPRVVGLLAAVLVALVALPAAAEAACPTTPTTQAFKRFGDLAQYSLVSNGAFESGAGGWSLSGAAVATGNESYKVHGAADSKSLAINPTGVAVSPAFCVGIEHPTFRFFARRTSGTWGVLNVKLRWTGSDGVTHDTVVGAVTSANTSWAPSLPMVLAPALPLWQTAQTVSVRIVFDPEDFGGAWAIDDVYVDPYRR